MIVICRKLLVAAAVLAIGLAACGGEPAGGSDREDERSRAARADAEGDGAESGPDSAAPDAGELDWPEEPVAHAQPVLRAVLTEHGAGRVHVIDVATGDTVRTVRVRGQARAELAGDATHVLLTQSAANATQVLDAGIRWVDHGGHLDPAHVEPEVVGSAPTENPVHVVPYRNRVTVFADDEGAAYVWRLGEDGLDPEPVRTLTTDRPHHGFGIALPDGRMLTGLPSEQRRNPLPDGVRLYGKDDQRIRDFRGCPALHGEYGHDDTFVFGCADGALVLERQDEGWDVDRLPNPSGGAESAGSDGAESGAEKGSVRLGAFYGNGDERIVGTFGEDAMALVDLDNGRIERIDLPAPRVDAIWDPYWEQVVVLTGDGRLHAIDPETGELSNSTRVLGEVEISTDLTRPRPSIGTGENWIYVTDPEQRRLIEVGISSDGFEPRRAKDLDFVPFSVGVLGMAP